MEQLTMAKQDLAASLDAQRAERERLEQEKAARDEELRRLTQTHAALTESLKSEIAKGDIRIRQVRDRLTINVVDQILFDSGRAQLKSRGIEVLQRVGEVLKTIPDKQIRIEGHTDNVPIGGRLKQRFPTNWELSAARATSVVRYLVDKGGVDPKHLTAVGHGDTHPVADNATEEGRQANRRIEIVLYPKDLSDIAQDVRS